MVVYPLYRHLLVPLRVPRLAQELRDLRVLVQLSSSARSEFTAVETLCVGVARHVSLDDITRDDRLAGSADSG